MADPWYVCYVDVLYVRAVRITPDRIVQIVKAMDYRSVVHIWDADRETTGVELCTDVPAVNL
jgi:hypothetical protein